MSVNCDSSDESEMSELSDYSSGFSDEEASDIECKLKPLAFMFYKTCGDTRDLDVAIPISEFNPAKLSLSENEINENNYDIKYEGHKLRVLLKAFSGLVKRSNVFEREKYIKIKDVSQRKLFWEICHEISAKLQQAYHEKRYEKFCFYNDWHKLFINFCDERLARRKMHYFEDVCVALDRICLIDEDAYSRHYRLISEMVDGKVIDDDLPGRCTRILLCQDKFVLIIGTFGFSPNFPRHFKTPIGLFCPAGLARSR